MNKEHFSNKKILFLFGCILGAIIFIYIYGVKVLNFTYDEWLMSGGDLTQHYLGWRFFRESNWNFPIGLMDGVIYPFRVSIIYMDSIPIFAIIFKIFSSFLPKTFQYFGLWGILSFMLQGGISALIINKFTYKINICLISSMFFLISPILMFRMFNHTALGGQWIILLSIYLYIELDNRYSKMKKILIWTMLLSLSVTIHMYFMPMILILILCYWIKEYIKNRDILISMMGFFVPVFFTLMTLIILGAFYGKSDGSDFGLGFYSANINALINPLIGYSKFMKDLPVATDGQYEGFAYLGMGVLILIIILIYIKIADLKIRDYKYIKSYLYDNVNKVTLLIAIIILFLLAWSPTIGINNKIIANIWYPPIIRKLLDVFRSSGRFMWPICYLIIIYTIKELINNSKSAQLLICLFICSIIQIGDISNIIKEKNQNFNVISTYDSRLKSESWNELVNEKYKHIVFIDNIESISPNSELVFAFSKYAVDNNLTLNDGYIARKDKESVNNLRGMYINELQQNIVKDDVIYVFKDELLCNGKYIDDMNKNLNYYKIDDIVIGIKGELNTEKKYNEELFEKQSILLYKNNKYLTNGQDTEEGRILNTQGISFGPYVNLKAGKYTIEILGENLNNVDYDSCYNQGQNKLDIEEIFRNDKQILFNFEINYAIENFECRLFNNSNGNVIIKQIHII